ncbi:MAG: bifunctional N-acetylglucosamine-1-phosphate uridyltransferase/glucosamine-1-phosphate acetyltransferase, partial [Actinobacteria bacterium]|nr:bifunctional N-acetylglucosamine-1-phosphate uridyltransferase/glucosamine-1-phosphate acetyltransferase [Actinomycetota bacterium]
LTVREINSGFCIFEAELLRKLLARLDPGNAQGEFYLTDVFQMARDDGAGVMVSVGDWSETQGVNDRVQLAEAAGVLRRRIAGRWMREGVTIIDPSSTFIDATVTLERDSTVLPFTFLEGSTSIAEGATVGPQARIVDSDIGSGANVSYSVVRGSSVGPGASVGPFASLRPGTTLKEGAKLGTFVESKNTTIGKDSKAGHLAYLGDAEIGERVNIGAGTITCNWDGKEKHKTVIKDDAYISSDTMLVAPVTIGEGAATGAGSVVRNDVPDGALAVGVPAKVLEGKGRRIEGKEGPRSGEERGSGS